MCDDEVALLQLPWTKCIDGFFDWDFILLDMALAIFSSIVFAAWKVNGIEFSACYWLRYQWLQPLELCQLLGHIDSIEYCVYATQPYLVVLLQNGFPAATRFTFYFVRFTVKLSVTIGKSIEMWCMWWRDAWLIHNDLLVILIIPI